MTSTLISVACALATEAAHKLTELSLLPLEKERKADHSIVTNADFAADKIIREGLMRAFPEHAILTEESGLHGSASAEYVWVVDPLDGTRAYAKAVAGYSVMIGLLRGGKPYAGVVADPWDNHLYYAEKGFGAFHEPLTWPSAILSPRQREITEDSFSQGEKMPEGQIRGSKKTPLSVSKRSEFAQMPIITSTGFPELMAKIIRQVLPSPWLTPINSVGIKVGLVVRQAADIYLNHHHVHYWDTCAPQVILEEAGGCITFFDGSPLTYALDKRYQHAEPTLVTNHTRHAELLKIVRPLLKSDRE